MLTETFLAEYFPPDLPFYYCVKLAHGVMSFITAFHKCSYLFFSHGSFHFITLLLFAVCYVTWISSSLLSPTLLRSLSPLCSSFIISVARTKHQDKRQHSREKVHFSLLSLSQVMVHHCEVASAAGRSLRQLVYHIISTDKSLKK